MHLRGWRESGRPAAIVRVAETETKRNGLAREILLSVVLPQLLLIAIAASVVWIGVVRGLRPLERLRHAVATRSHRDRKPLDDDRVPAEVSPLLQAIDELLGRLDRARTLQNRFIAELQAFVDRIAAAGQYNALAQLAIKLLSPGVPDIYQGQELWDWSLVDPDNRRPVDYSQRRELLAAVGQPFLSANVGQTFPPASSCSGKPVCWPHAPLHDPRLKLLVTHRLLAARRRLANLWSEGDYVPLEVAGPLADHLLAFAWRGAESQRLELIVAVPRFVQKLFDAQRAQEANPSSPRFAYLPAFNWNDTAVTLPVASPLAARNIVSNDPLTLHDGHVAASELFAHFPLAVLETFADQA